MKIIEERFKVVTFEPLEPGWLFRVWSEPAMPSILAHLLKMQNTFCQESHFSMKIKPSVKAEINERG